MISPLADASHNIGDSGQVFACVPTKETLGRKPPHVVPN